MSAAVERGDLKTYEFTQVNQVAKKGAEEVTKFLYSLQNTVAVINVENDNYYQDKDIDLIWRYYSNELNKTLEKTIEIKADRHHYTGNYFFETVSNIQKNTPGCFMYTESDVIFYYYIEKKELHMLPTIKTRNWFISNRSRFKEAKTSTTGSKGLLYTSKGSKVPRGIVKNEVPIKIVNISHLL